MPKNRGRRSDAIELGNFTPLGGGLGLGRTKTGASSNMNMSIWTWLCVLLILAAFVMSIIALILVHEIDAHWDKVNETHIVSRAEDADVEIRDGSDFILHNRILDSFAHVVYEKIILDPFFGPEGPDLLFGDPGATYTRLQAFSAIGFRVWDRFFIPFLPFPFTPVGLFGESALAVVIGDFATWIHGPIIGSGPAILLLSDESAKENIQSLDPAKSLVGVSKLEPRSFDWKGASSAEVGGKITERVKAHAQGMHGFVAQEVGAIVPGAVHSTSDYLPEDTDFSQHPPIELLDFNAIVTELVGAVQSLWANGVIGSAQGLSPPDRLGISACFNATNFPGQREKARCICETQRCGTARIPNEACLGVEQACGVRGG